MISTVGTRPTPGLIDGSSFWATMAFMLKAMALRKAGCMSAETGRECGRSSEAALEAWIVPNTRCPVSAA